MPIDTLAKIDRIATETNLTAAPTGRRKRIPRRIAEVVNLLVTGECKTIKAAAARAGMHPNYVSAALKKPSIRVFCAERVRQSLSAGSMRASARMLELLDNPSAKISFEASRFVLGVDGVRPVEGPSIAVNLTAAVGYVIDLSSPSDRRDQHRGPTIDAAVAGEGD
jgi:hypothetical protein